MCTLCLSDMGEPRDEWLREPSRVWIGALIFVIGVAATVAVGVELYRSTALPMSYDRR